MKAIKSEGYVSIADYKAFIKFHLMRGKYYRLKSAMLIFGILIIAVGLITFGWLIHNKGMLIGGGAVLLCLIMFFYTLNVNVKRVCTGKAKTVRAIQKTAFGKNGFVFDLVFKDPEENEHDEIFFDELEVVYVTRNTIYLYIEKRSVIIIPKRNLKISPEEAFAYLQKYIPSEKLVVCA